MLEIDLWHPADFALDSTPVNVLVALGKPDCVGTIGLPVRRSGADLWRWEGSIFIAGAGSRARWLRDGLKDHRGSSDPNSQQLWPEAAELAEQRPSTSCRPSTGSLARPTGTSDARGAILGLARNSGPAEFARAALESVGYQTRDLWEAMTADWRAAGHGGARRPR